MFDIILIVVITVCTVYGLLKGLLQAVFGMAGIIIGIVIASRTFKALAYTLPWNPEVSNVVAFIILFLLIAILINLIGIIVKKIIKFIHLRWIDKLVGGMIGLLIGSIICGLISLSVSAFPKGQQVLKESKIGPLVLKELMIIKGLVPSNMHEKIRWRTPREKQSYLLQGSFSEPFSQLQRDIFRPENQVWSQELLQEPY